MSGPLQVECSACQRVHEFPQRLGPELGEHRSAARSWLEFHTWHHEHAGEDCTLTVLEQRVDHARPIRDVELDLARAFVEGLREGRRRAVAELRRFVVAFGAGRDAGKAGG